MIDIIVYVFVLQQQQQQQQEFEFKLVYIYLKFSKKKPLQLQRLFCKINYIFLYKHAFSVNFFTLQTANCIVLI